MERTPWTFDSILAIASKIRSGNAPLSSTFYKCLEEAQGIARSSLFGPVVRKEAVMGERFRIRGTRWMTLPWQGCCFLLPGARMDGSQVAMLCAWH